MPSGGFQRVRVSMCAVVFVPLRHIQWVARSLQQCPITHLVSHVKLSGKMLSVTKNDGIFYISCSSTFWALKSNRKKLFGKRTFAHSWEKGGGFFYILLSAIPFTNSSVLFIPHGGLLRFTAGLLTLDNSMQPMWFQAWKTITASRIPLFVFQRCQIATNYLTTDFPNGKNDSCVLNWIICHACAMLPITRRPHLLWYKRRMSQPCLNIFRT